jgi:hypothetical protein
MSVNDAIGEAPDRKKVLVEHLLRFADILQGLSGRFKGVARNLTLAGLLGALILDLLMKSTWGWGWTTTTVVGVILILPALVIGWGWYVLEEATGLPQRILNWLSGAKEYAGTVVQRNFNAETPSAQTSRLSDLKSVGGLAVEIASLGMDASGLLGILGGSLSVTNPIYLLAVTVSVALIGLLDVVAVIWGMARLL